MYDFLQKNEYKGRTEEKERKQQQRPINDMPTALIPAKI